MVGSASSALGPTVAAGILSVADWPWLFAVNVPIGVLVLIARRQALPHTPRAGIGSTGASAALNAVTFGLLISGIEALGHGGSPAYAVSRDRRRRGAGWALVRRQVLARQPAAAGRPAARPIFALSVAASICSFAAQSMAFVPLPFYIRGELGLSRGRDRAADDALAVDGGAGRAVRRTAGGPLSRRHHGRARAGVHGCAAWSRWRSCRHMPALSNIGWRMALCGLGFRLVQLAQQPGHHRLGAARRAAAGRAGCRPRSRLLGQTSGTALVALIFGLLSTGTITASLSLAASFALISCVASVLRTGRSASVNY